MFTACTYKNNQGRNSENRQNTPKIECCRHGLIGALAFELSQYNSEKSFYAKLKVIKAFKHPRP
jgi:hypothetical protein